MCGGIDDRRNDFRLNRLAATLDRYTPKKRK